MTSLAELVARYLTARTVEEAQAAATEIMDRVAPNLQIYIAPKCDRDDWEDLVQEMLLAIFQGLGKCQGTSDGQIWSWCYGVARHKLADYYRRRARAQVDYVDPNELREIVEASARDKVLNSTDWQSVENALAVFKAAKSPCYDLLWARYILGFDHKRIAAEYGLNYASVHVKIGRCLRDLADAVKGT